MVRVSTFCPRCGEAIETEVPDEARATQRAELACPACRFEFVIAPARRAGDTSGAPIKAAPSTGPREGPVRATVTTRAAGTGPRPISFKPLAAGLMLIFAAVIGLWMGSVLVFSDDLVEAGFRGMAGEGVFTGEVEDESGAPVEGVHVEVVRGPDGEEIPPLDRPNATTGPEGHYAFEGLEPGVHLFSFTHPDRRTVQLEAPAYPSDYSPLFGDASAFGTITMPIGDPQDTMEVSRLQEFESLARGWGWFTLGASIVTLGGAWAALRRKGFGLAVAGASAGILTFGFIIGSVVSLLALILILFARKEFRPLRDAPNDGVA